ncbi:MAG: hypothetical protein A2W02_03920 [Alphaproteobacteria bacterium RBG_16_64_48]|nr:MAG: hypothetical protein A2W02_03920 [Alphaproteobacteria bacterium RBG_16_64_48]
MLKQLTEEQARHIAALARGVRNARDALLDNVPDEDMGEPPAARGEQNPTAAFALDPLPPDDPAVAALQQALTALEAAARSELFVLMRMGQGDFAICDWDRALSEADLLGEKTVTAALIEDLDLHDHVTKGLYEIGSSSST